MLLVGFNFSSNMNILPTIKRLLTFKLTRAEMLQFNKKHFIAGNSFCFGHFKRQITQSKEPVLLSLHIQLKENLSQTFLEDFIVNFV